MIDLTLNSLKWPAGAGTSVGVEGATPTMAQMAHNIEMPFTSGHPIPVAEDSTTSAIEHDSTLTLQACTVTLGAPSVAGLTVTVLGAMSTGQGFVVCKDANGADVAEGISAGTRCEFVSDSTSWHLYKRVSCGDDIAPSADVKVRTNRYLRHSFDTAKHNTLVLKAGTHIRLDVAGDVTQHRWLDIASDTEIDVASLITAEAGHDYCLYLVPSTDGGVDIVASENTTFPDTFTADNSRKIGWFHTECANIPDTTTMIAAASSGAQAGDMYLVKAAADSESKAFYTKEVTAVQANAIYDTVTCAHPLAGWQAGDVLPESVFCLTFRPQCEPEGMLFDADADAASYGAIDIYLQSGTGANTRSAFGAPPTRTRQQQNHEDDLRSVGKRLLTDEEFTAVALGSNELTAIKGAAEASIASGTGGHVDTADRRMVSATGAEDCCGAVWQWLCNAGANDLVKWAWGAGNGLTGINVHPTGGDTWYSYDGVNKMGQMYGHSFALIAGTGWCSGGYAGSRSRNGVARSTAGADIGARGASRVVRG